MNYTPPKDSVYRDENSPWGIASMLIDPNHFPLEAVDPFVHKYLQIMALPIE